MPEVHPITTRTAVKSVYDDLTNTGNIREREVFVIGIHVGLRIGDLLNLKFADVEGSHIDIIEQKTGNKRQPIRITPVIRASIERLKNWYAETHPNLEPVYLFQSTSNRIQGQVKSIRPNYFSRVFKAACDQVPELAGSYASHTLRKTFGFNLYNENNQDIAMVQKILGHKKQSETLVYIGVTKLKIENAMSGLNLLD